jgi:hypothetical protein
MRLVNYRSAPRLPSNLEPYLTLRREQCGSVPKSRVVAKSPPSCSDHA